MKKNPHKNTSPVEKVLLSSQKNYEELFNSLNDAATLFEMRSNGLPGRYLEVNDTLCRWLGYTREELLKLSPLDISEKEDETVNSEVAGTFTKKGKSVIERTLVAKDGRKIPVEVNFHLITFEGKKAVLSISRDVSERKAAEAALRESEEKFRQTFYLSPDSVTINRASDGAYVSVNKGFCRMTGYSEKEIIGKTSGVELSIWNDIADRDRLAAGLKEQGTVENLTAWFRMKNGDLRYGIMSATLFDLYGEPHLLSITRDITALKKAEDALRESEEKFRSMIEQNLEGFSLIDETGNIIEWNAALEEMTGIRRSDAIGKPMWAVQTMMRPDEAKSAGFHERIREMMRSMIKSGDNPMLGKPFETPIRKPDGSSAVIQQIVFPIKSKTGFRFGSIKRDITEQKKAMQALAESEEKFRTTVEQSLEGFSLIDEKGLVIEWNAALECITGIARSAAIGRTLWEVHESMRLPEQRTAERLEKGKKNILGSLRHAETPYVGKLQETVIYRPDRTPVTIQQIVYSIKTAIGTRLGSVIRDITEQKKVSEALRTSELRFKTLIENAFEGITVVDRNFKVKYESPGLNRILGYSTEERYGTSAFDSVHPDDAAQAQEAFGRAMAHPDEIFQMILRIKHKDGAWRWIECIGKNLLDDATISGIVINYRDVTERKQAEEAQQKLEQQIQQVEKLESIGILAGGIAHDFNNLLTGIFGYIDVARLYNSSGESDKVTMNLSKALDVFNRARALTQQLLTFSKGGSPVKKTLSLSPLLTSTANFVLSGSNVSARFSFSNDLWPCEVDENQLGQVIDNIIINARQAMPTGGSIVVTAENILEGQPVPAPLVPGSYVRISIRDFGTGISKKHLPHIFDPFFTTKQEGSGLGLATAYSIVRKHEGIIEVESELGIGSTFHLYLPALPSAAAESLSTGIKKHRGQGVVLVMDDEEFIRDVAMELVKTMGYSAEPAKNGEEAVAKYKKAFSSPAPYALVILDLTVPGGMGGKDTVQELLKINPSVAAIASSGYSHDPVMTDPQAFGFKDKIRKPFTKEELGEVLERVVASNR